MFHKSGKSIRDFIRPYFERGFLICVLVLAMAGAGMSMAVKGFGLILTKEPIELKKPLDFLDENGLGAYKLLAKDRIDSAEVIESLGTKDYIQWILEDSEASAQSAVRNCMLFITYYPLPDAVPHVPEECYMGSGNQRLSAESVLLKVKKRIAGEGLPVPAGGGSNILEVPARYLVFSCPKTDIWEADSRFSILYFFNVNGEYKCTRAEARFVLNKNIYKKHSYFSKVEWQFFGMRYGRRIYPSKQEAIAASEKLLGIMLPILEDEHWPDWDR